MFRRLSTKLTVLYGALFGVALLAVALSVHALISQSAAVQVRSELKANAAVFDRVWTLRESQLRDSAGILGRDFGFRNAVATKDAPTIQSALDNLRRRLGIDRAFLITVDGDVVGAGTSSDAALSSLWNALDSGERTSGVLMLDEHPYQAVSAEVLAPNLVGWIVFAAEINDAHLRSFESLAAIPLEASLFTRADKKAWTARDPRLNARDRARIAGLLAAPRQDAAPTRIALHGGDAVTLFKPLHAYDGEEATLMLRYGMALAMRPYQPLLAAIVFVGLLGIVLVAAASWVLARGLTRPIAALERAAQSLQRGENAEVAVETVDEIGRLAQSFNLMSQEIVTREERITFMAFHDLDTDLLNRRALERVIDDRDGAFVVAFSVQRYNSIRGAIGYELAARLMRELGVRARAAAPDHPWARLGADTVAVIAPAHNESAALAFADGVRAAIEGRVHVDGVGVDVSLCCGLAALEIRGDHDALDRALIAVEQARAGYRARAVFDAGAYGDPTQNLSLMSEMVDDINRGRLALHYQPKLDIRTGLITGAEALVRWTHPTRGRIPPDLFVTMAEETGHIGVLSEWALMEAVAAQQVLRDAGSRLVVSVNLSGNLIGDDAFTDVALSVVEDNRADLCLEITETAAMRDPEAALRNIDRYTTGGVAISIDDYGSGLSSLSYLKRIRARELKLDKAFTQSLGVDARDALLVKSTIDLAHGLGMKIVAEGVEEETTLAALAGMGCDVAQGYLIGRPMPLSDLVKRLARPRELRAREA